MKAAVAFAIVTFVAGGTSADETAYRADLDCYAFFHDVPPNSGSPEAVAARAAYRDRAIARGRAIGLGPEAVDAQARAGRTRLRAELDGMGAHPAEERQERQHDACVARLGI